MNGYLPFIKKLQNNLEKNAVKKILFLSLLHVLILLGVALAPNTGAAVNRCDDWAFHVPICPDPLTPSPVLPTPDPYCLNDCSALFTNQATVSRQLIPLNTTYNPNVSSNLSTILTPPVSASSACNTECNDASITAPCPSTSAQVEQFCASLYFNNGGFPELIAMENECRNNCTGHLTTQCQRKCGIEENCESTVCSSLTGGTQAQCNTDCETLSTCTNDCGSTPSCYDNCAKRIHCDNFCQSNQGYLAGPDLSRCQAMCLDVINSSNGLTSNSECNNYCTLNYPDPAGSIYGSNASCSSYWYPTIGVGVEIAAGATCSFIEIKRDHHEVLRVDWSDPVWTERTYAYDRTTFGYSSADTMRYGYYAGIKENANTGAAQVCIFEGGFGHTWPEDWRGMNNNVNHGLSLGVTALMDAINNRRSYAQAQSHQVDSCAQIPLPSGPPPCCRNLATAPPTPTLQSIEFDASITYIPTASRGFSTFTSPKVRVIFDPSDDPADIHVDLLWDYTTDLAGAENAGLGQEECRTIRGPTNRDREFCTRMNETHSQLCVYERGNGATIGCIDRTLNMTDVTPRPTIQHSAGSNYSRPSVDFTFVGQTLTLAHTLDQSDRCGILYGRTFCAERQYDHPNYPGDEVIGITGFYQAAAQELSAHAVQTADSNPDGLAVLAPAIPCPATNALNNTNGFTTWESAEALYAQGDTRNPVLSPPCQIGYPTAEGCRQCPVGYRQSAGGPPTRQCIRLGVQSSQWGTVTNPCIENICPAGTTYPSTSTPGYQPYLDVYWPETVSSKNYYTPTTVTTIAEDHSTPICRDRNYKVGVSGPPQRTCDYNGHWGAPNTIVRGCIEKGCIAVGTGSGNRAEHGYATWPAGLAGKYFISLACIGNREPYTTNYTLYSSETTISNAYRTTRYYNGYRTNYSQNPSRQMVSNSGESWGNKPVRQCTYDPMDINNNDGIWNTVQGECRNICPTVPTSFGGHWNQQRPVAIVYKFCSEWSNTQAGHISRTCQANGTWSAENFSNCSRKAEATWRLRRNNYNGHDWWVTWGPNMYSGNYGVLSNTGTMCHTYPNAGYACIDYTNHINYINITSGIFRICTGANYSGQCTNIGPGNHSWPKVNGVPANSIRVHDWDG